jgi:hypothetical protein
VRTVYPWVVGLVVLFGGTAAVGWLGARVGLRYGDGILFSTGLVLLWYTIETRNMRLQMVRQNDMAVRPLLVTSVGVTHHEGPAWQGKPDLQEERLVIRNIGRGPALSVHIEDIVEERLRVSFGTLDVIPAEAIEPASATVYVEGGIADNKPSAFVPLLGPTSNQTYRLTVRYRDVTGESHFSVMQMGKDGTRLLEHSGVAI